MNNLKAIETINGKKYFVKDAYGSVDKHATIKEIYESFNGWYWLITNYEAKGTIAYGYVTGTCPFPEWGTSYMSDIKRSAWKVPVSNWSTISHVAVA